MPADTRVTEQLMRLVQDALASTETPGAALAVLVNGEPYANLAVGFTDLAQTQPLPADACWYIYSVTKSLIATLIVRLAEGGAVALDAPVQAYLPDLVLPHPVTLRQLLKHTGGLPDYGGLPAYTAAIRADPTHPWRDVEFLATALAQGPLFAPGAGWAYSNIGYMLVRRVLEAVHGHPFAAIIAAELAAPLGLPHTCVVANLADAQPLTSGYSSLLSPDGALADIHTRYHPGWVAHGVVGAPALELAQIIDALGAGRLLSAAGLAAMIDAVPVRVQHPFFRAPAYGLGLMVDQASPAGLLFGHGGGGPGYAIGALCAPDAAGRRITVTAMANRDQPDLGLRIAFEAVMLVSGL